MSAQPAVTEPIMIGDIRLGAEILRVELKILNGRPIISAWRFWRDVTGELRPGRHGLACSIDRLPEIIAALNAARERAVAEGLL
jgi:hypothetical protein